MVFTINYLSGDANHIYVFENADAWESWTIDFEKRIKGCIAAINQIPLASD